VSVAAVHANHDGDAALLDAHVGTVAGLQRDAVSMLFAAIEAPLDHRVLFERNR
jgi:hypothetical protein